MTFTEDELNKRFGHTKASIDTPEDEYHEELRAAFKKLSLLLDSRVPEGRAKATAFTNLETASMWFHKALAWDK